MNNLNTRLTKAIHELIPEAGLERVEAIPCPSCAGEPPCKTCINHPLQKLTTLEPELRHVLLALKTVRMRGLEIFCNVDGEIHHNDHIFSEPEAVYDLTHSLYGQTDELKQWLLDLLTK